MNFFSSIILEWKTCPQHCTLSSKSKHQAIASLREDKNLLKSTSSQVSLRLTCRLQIAQESLSVCVCMLDVWVFIHTHKAMHVLVWFPKNTNKKSIEREVSHLQDILRLKTKKGVCMSVGDGEKKDRQNTNNESLHFLNQWSISATKPPITSLYLFSMCEK